MHQKVLTIMGAVCCVGWLFISSNGGADCGEPHGPEGIETPAPVESHSTPSSSKSDLPPTASSTPDSGPGTAQDQLGLTVDPTNPYSFLDEGTDKLGDAVTFGEATGRNTAEQLINGIFYYYVRAAQEYEEKVNEWREDRAELRESGLIQEFDEAKAEADAAWKKIFQDDGQKEEMDKLKEIQKDLERNQRLLSSAELSLKYARTENERKGDQHAVDQFRKDLTESENRVNEVRDRLSALDSRFDEILDDYFNKANTLRDLRGRLNAIDDTYLKGRDAQSAPLPSATSTGK